MAFRSRFFMAPFTFGIQLFLAYFLWTSVYGHTRTSGGLNVHQATDYALVALIVARVRWRARAYSTDSILARMRDGTIVYWFLRPISPARYYLLKQLGDLACGATWSLLAFGALLAAGLLPPPSSVLVAVTFAATLLLGQVLLYYLGALMDLTTFWLVTNSGVVDIYNFVQDLLAGVYVPLWLLPPLPRAAAMWLPFSAAINVPVSLYVHRLAPGDAVGEVVRQTVWIVALALAARWLWLRAAHHLDSVGG
jgi:ABC-2 type transport system permease protein